jgi:hypothetical protein
VLIYTPKYTFSCTFISICILKDIFILHLCIHFISNSVCMIACAYLNLFQVSYTNIANFEYILYMFIFINVFIHLDGGIENHLPVVSVDLQRMLAVMGSTIGTGLLSVGKYIYIYKYIHIYIYIYAYVCAFEDTHNF